MAKTILTDCSVTVNGVNLSDHVESVEINSEVEDVDLTAMGATAREHGQGLRNDSMTFNFFQDFSASKVDATFWPLLSNTGFTVVVKPTSAAVSTTNPSFTATCLLFTYQPLAGSVGEASQTSIELQCSGAIVRATT